MNTSRVWRNVLLGGMALVLFSLRARAAIVRVYISEDPQAKPLAPRFLGLSYEAREILPKEGKHYFNPDDASLVSVYRTLGIKSLRVGANAVDDPKVAVPDEKDIDAVFKFGRAAGVKVIYSFRLRNGDPFHAAQLATYIEKKYSDVLDCFCIGNEPNFYLKTYDAFRAAWKPEYDTILKSVPHAMFDGPATSGREYVLRFADEFFPAGHIAMVSTHSYPLGNGRQAEKNPAAARARFLANRTEERYQTIYDGLIPALDKMHIPFRMDETNSCFHGGARNSSDTYASTLWGLDYINWWAAHHILGLNFHTGDTVNGIPPMVANYAAFVHTANGTDFDIRPISYAMLAFTEIAHGTPMRVKCDADPELNFKAYAFADAGAIYVALLNKSYGDSGTPVTATVQLPGKLASGRYQRIDLTQADSDIAAKTGVELGGSPISPGGKWHAKWQTATAENIAIPPASAALLKFSVPGRHE